VKRFRPTEIGKAMARNGSKIEVIEVQVEVAEHHGIDKIRCAKLRCLGNVSVLVVTSDGVSNLLGGGLLVLGLSGGRDSVDLSLDKVGSLLDEALLRVGLEGSASLVGKVLSASVGHGDGLFELG